MKSRLCVRIEQLDGEFVDARSSVRAWRMPQSKKDWVFLVRGNEWRSEGSEAWQLPQAIAGPDLVLVKSDGFEPGGSTSALAMWSCLQPVSVQGQSAAEKIVAEATVQLSSAERQSCRRCLITPLPDSRVSDAAHLKVGQDLWLVLLPLDFVGAVKVCKSLLDDWCHTQ